MTFFPIGLVSIALLSNGERWSTYQPFIPMCRPISTNALTSSLLPVKEWTCGGKDDIKPMQTDVLKTRSFENCSQNSTILWPADCWSRLLASRWHRCHYLCVSEPPALTALPTNTANVRALIPGFFLGQEHFQNNSSHLCSQKAHYAFQMKNSKYIFYIQSQTKWFEGNLGLVRISGQ